MLNSILFLVETESDKIFVTKVYEKYSQILHAYAIKKICDRNIAYDITHDTFLGFLRNLDHLRNQPMDSIYAYLFTIQKNLIKKYYINKSREDNVLSLDFKEDVPSDEDINELVSSNEQYNIIISAIHKLSSIYSDVLLLHLVHEIPLKEIAKSLHISYDTVKKRYSRGMKHLTNTLKEIKK